MILDNMGAKYNGDHVQLLATDGAVVIIGMQGGRKGTLDLASLMGDVASSPRTRCAPDRSRRRQRSAAVWCRTSATHCGRTITQPPLPSSPWPRRPPHARTSQVTTSARSSCPWRARPVSRFSAQGREAAGSGRTRRRLSAQGYECSGSGPFEAPLLHTRSTMRLIHHLVTDISPQRR